MSRKGYNIMDYLLTGREEARKRVAELEDENARLRKEIEELKAKLVVHVHDQAWGASGGLQIQCGLCGQHLIGRMLDHVCKPKEK